MSSIERRLARFIANERISVPLIWKLFLEQVLAPFRGQQLSFVLDKTPIRSDLTIVYLGLLVHSRVSRHADAASSAPLVAGTISCASVQNIRGRALLPRQIGKVVEALWADRAAPPGYRRSGKARVWQEETLDTYVSLVWDTDCEEPWLLISDQGAGRRQVQEYAWRMRVEATFQESKSRGWKILRQLDCGSGSLGSPRQGYLSAGKALAFRHATSGSQSCFVEALFPFPEDKHGVALCLTLLTQQVFRHLRRALLPACNKCLGGSARRWVKRRLAGHGRRDGRLRWSRSSTTHSK